MQSINHLVDHPEAGVALENSEVRKWVSGDYVVYYQPGVSRALVLRIWHGRELRSE